MSSTSDETPEADIRDLLVEAFFTGHLDRVRDLGPAIVERSLEPGADIMPFGDEVASGTLLTPDLLPDEFEELWILDGHLPPERLAALEDGADLTPHELALAQD